MRSSAKACHRVRDCISLHSAPRGELTDQGGHFHDAYALAPGDWVLVRPDGYVGAIVTSGEIAALENYMQLVGLDSGGDGHA